MTTVNQGTPTSTPTDAENLSSELNKTGKPVLRRDWFCVLILLFQMVLMASTWRLWGLPSMSSFPTVPLIAAFGQAPDTLHLILSVSLIGCCVAVFIRELTHCERDACNGQPAPRSSEDCSGDHLPKRERGFVASLTFRVRKSIARTCVIGGDFLSRFGLRSAVSGDAGGAGRGRKNDLLTWGVALTAIGLVVLNQHRLQPWHWLFILIFCQKAILNELSRWHVHRVTFASIYIFAGLSRIGEHVAEGAARQIVFQTFGWLGISQTLRNDDVVYWSCLVMTCAEAVIGILLLARATRKAAVWMAVAMHLFLLIALGPLGLNHHPGVQIWNLFFIVATPILFSDFCMTKENSFRSSDQQVTRDLRAGKPGTATERSRDGKSAENFRAAVVLAFVVLFPLSGLFGIADNWPSWQVYSPRPEVVRVFVRNSVVDELPAEMRVFLGQPAPLQDWSPLRIDQWSLSAVNAPIYPQERFGLAVAMEVGEHIPPGDIQVTIERPQLWYWRSHTVVHLTGLDAIRSAATARAGHAGFERN